MEIDIEILNERLNILFNAISIDDFGRIIGQRELVKEIDKLKLYIYPNDHNPPHFHIKCREFDVCFLIENCEILKGSIDGKNHKKIKYWHESSKENLIKVWDKLNDDINRQ